MIEVNFNNTIVERDMDMLLAEGLASDAEFCQMIVDKTDLKGRPFVVKKIEVSKEDKQLGESDVTAIIDVAGTVYGFLFEDKIDAIAMPNQHERYIKRAEKAIAKGEYKDYRIFIFCPEKYYKNNSEAKLYEHVLTYEECKAYFDNREDLLSAFRSQQLGQAIQKAKKPPTVDVDENANAFLRQYINYQKSNYPTLDLSTKEDRNGWWTDFRTELGKVYINHKLREGYVDLTFPKAADQIDKAKAIAEWARNHKLPGTTVVKTKVSIMIRIHVPKLDIMKGFDNIDNDELNQCFETIKDLTEFANTIAIANSIAKK